MGALWWPLEETPQEWDKHPACGRCFLKYGTTKEAHEKDDCAG